jgi:hypothetical protein
VLELAPLPYWKHLTEEQRRARAGCAYRVPRRDLKHGLQHRHVISGEEVHVEHIQRS